MQLWNGHLARFKIKKTGKMPVPLILYRFRLYRNDLTAEGAEDTEGENREMNNSDATGFGIKSS